jgi:uncharacterized peroxidase-related enzyme
MSRMAQIQPETASGETKELFDVVKSKMGRVPNMMKALANSPAALNAYLQFSGAVAAGALPPRTREQISLAVSQVNSCEYCLAAHTAIGKMVGLNAEQILDSRRGTAADRKADAILHFSLKLVEDRGAVSDEDLQAVRKAGVTDGEIAEIVANVALNAFTNYFNRLAETDVDFPKVEPAEALTASGYSA